MNKPTPGPYRVAICHEWNNPYNYVGVHGPDNKCCFHTNGGPGHADTCEAVAERMNRAYAAGMRAANADLLAACKAAHKSIAGMFERGGPQPGQAGIDEWCGVQQALYTAIAQAEGGAANG